MAFSKGKTVNSAMKIQWSPPFKEKGKESISARSTTMFEGQLIFVKSKFIGSISENAVNNINTQSKKEE